MSGKRAKANRRGSTTEVNGVLRNALARLRAIFRRRAPGLFEARPEWRRPCHSCAFAPSTDAWQGWDTTVLNLVQALEQGVPFWCHEPLPRGGPEGWTWEADKARVCMGWAAIVADRGAKLAMVRASVDRELTDEQAEALLARIPDSVRRIRCGQAIDQVERIQR